jgi:hypothetical protein
MDFRANFKVLPLPDQRQCDFAALRGCAVQQPVADSGACAGAEKGTEAERIRTGDAREYEK